MGLGISAELAQQIVTTVKDLFGYDALIIEDSRIVAATETARIGNSHTAGGLVIEKKQPLSVYTPNDYYGSKEGYLLPIFIDNECISAIGMTGNPDEVMKFVYIAQRITVMMIREHMVEVHSHNDKTRSDILIQSMITGQGNSEHFMVEHLQKHKYWAKNLHRMIIVQTPESNSPDVSLDYRETVFHAFDQTDSDIYTFSYPCEFILLTKNDLSQKDVYCLKKLLSSHPELKASIGPALKLDRQKQSYLLAKQALRRTPCGTISNTDDMDLEFIYNQIGHTARNIFIAKIISALNQDQVKVLDTYFRTNMNLKETSQELSIHRNTLQYQLNKIKEDTGYDPRSFQDAVCLYLAIELSK